MENVKSQTLVQSIKLIDGVFTTSQAKDVINDLIDTKINYHKISRLSLTIGNQNEETIYDNKRLNELIHEKKRLMQAVKEAKENGKKIKLMSLIDIEYID